MLLLSAAAMRPRFLAEAMPLYAIVTAVEASRQLLVRYETRVPIIMIECSSPDFRTCHARKRRRQLVNQD
jgi:hypothetical protein